MIQVKLRRVIFLGSLGSCTSSPKVIYYYLSECIVGDQAIISCVVVSYAVVGRLLLVALILIQVFVYDLGLWFVG